jgi:hypothetical protein
MAHEPDGEQQLRTTRPAPPSGESPASPLPSRPSPAQPDPGSATSRPGGPPAPPPRPGLSYASPAPIVVTPPTPRFVRVARTLWLFSFVAGFAVLVGSFLTRDSHLERLRAVVDGMSPGGDADALTAASAIVFWGSLGAMLLVILLEAAALAIINGRQGWVRWLMVPLLLAHGGAVLVTEAFLVPEGDGGSYVWLLWGAQLLMAFAGLVLLFMPSSNAWLRSRKQA